MKVILLPFGSYLVGESRDQDFVAFPFDQALVGLLNPDKHIEVEAEQWNTESVSTGAKEAGFLDPDIWMSDQVGDMKPIIVANLVKDYPQAAEYIQKVMGRVNLQGEDIVLKEALDANVKRWNEGIPHIPNLRKRVFSRIQRDAYAQGLGFFNTKSEIANAAKLLQLVGDTADVLDLSDFLTGKNVEPWYDRPSDPKSLSKVISLVSRQENVHSYQSEHGCILELASFEERIPKRTYLTPIETHEKEVYVFWEEIYTYNSFSGMIEIEKETWLMLLSIDLKEVQ